MKTSVSSPPGGGRVGAAILRLLLAAAVGLSFANTSSPQLPGAVDQLTRSAQLVFRGTVQRVGAANLSSVRAGDETVVVRVDEVLKAPPSLGALSGREITVRLRQPRSASPGEEAVFFANGWLFGTTLAVVEVGRLHGAAADLRLQVAAAEQERQEEELKQHLDRAALVVAGTVVETRPAAERRGEGRPESEHDPRWWEAVIRVDSVLQGQPVGGSVVLLFPASADVLWSEAPKPRVGWSGIWLLYRDQIPGLTVDGYTALKPWNLLARDQAATVRRLLRR